MRTERRCCICGVKYQEMKNIGAWKCYQHPGTIRNGKWTCCNLPAGNSDNVERFYSIGRSNAEKGCVRCDHRITFKCFDASSGIMILSTRWYTFMEREGLTIPQALIEKNSEQAKVRRYDSETDEKLNQVMSLHFNSEGIPSMKQHTVTGTLSQRPELLQQMLDRI